MLCHSQKKRSQVAAGVSSSSARGCTAGLVPAGERDGPQRSRRAGQLCCVPDATTAWGPHTGSTGPPGILPAPTPGKQQEERLHRGHGASLRALQASNCRKVFPAHPAPFASSQHHAKKTVLYMQGVQENSFLPLQQKVPGLSTLTKQLFFVLSLLFLAHHALCYCLLHSVQISSNCLAVVP